MEKRFMHIETSFVDFFYSIWCMTSFSKTSCMALSALRATAKTIDLSKVYFSRE